MITLIIFLMLTSPTQSQTIGGAYATLIICVWGQYDDRTGHIGLYDVSGDRYVIFFGSSYCEY